MKCLVTGGKGFIGSHVVELLVDEGHEVIVIDNETSVSNEIFYEVPGVAYYKEDMCDSSTHSYYDGVDWVFHLAARARIQASLANPTDTFINNVIGTQSVLEASRHAGVKKVVYSGSSSYYGLKNEIPNHEGQPSDCLNPYSLSKYQGEELCRLYAGLWDVDAVILRYFNVYGPREPLRGQYAPVVGIFKRQRSDGDLLTIVGDGEQRRDFTYVKDVARANLLAAQSDINFEVLNIGSGTNYSVNEVAELIGGAAVNIPPRPAEARVTLANNDKARRLLGWTPSVTLPDIINEYA
tara:strand:- start:237 stop:1121 length:885 start_codon:yes stop_codon:yes gene_type:complete